MKTLNLLRVWPTTYKAPWAPLTKGRGLWVIRMTFAKDSLCCAPESTDTNHFLAVKIRLKDIKQLFLWGNETNVVCGASPQYSVIRPTFTTHPCVPSTIMLVERGNKYLTSNKYLEQVIQLLFLRAHNLKMKVRMETQKMLWKKRVYSFALDIEM